jgi:hypothetical protein
MICRGPGLQEVNAGVKVVTASPTKGFVDAGQHVNLDRRPSITARPPISISRKISGKATFAPKPAWHQAYART